MKSNWPLVALVIGAFSIGTTEFAPMGLLPIIAQGVHVSIPSAGMLITAYAVGVMVGAPLMTLSLGLLRRRMALVVLMGIFTVGNLLSAVAPGYDSLMAARVVTSLAHGAFFGLGSVAAASLVPRDRQASAIATMFMGLTLANIGGVPAATWVGQMVGWRMAFLATAGLGLLSMLALLLALPQGEVGRMPEIRREISVLGRPVVQRALATTSLAAGAMFTLYTYIAPVLVHLADASPGFITGMLVLIGVGFTIGNMIGGRLADRSIDGALIACLGALTVIMLAFAFVAVTYLGTAVMLLLWGAAFFASTPALQMRVMQAAHEAPGLASSVNIGAFNLGNAVGAAAGGAALSLGLGYASLPIVGALFSAGGLLVVLLNRDRAVALAP